jgi:tetratricopeptide (TPR) repeat protein
MKSTSFPRSRLLALALCLVLSAGCTKAYKAKRVLAAADRDYQAQKYDLAEAEYISALRFLPSNAIANGNLGSIYFEEGRAPAAYYYLSLANKQDNKNPQVQLRLAELLGTTGGTNAVTLLRRVLQAEPTNEHALLLLAQLSPPNDLIHVREQLEAQLQEGQAAAACRSALGWIDLRTQKIRDAETEFQSAASLDPKLASPHLGLALIYSLQKDEMRFQQALKTAAELSPIRSSARIKYAEFEIQSGAEDQARQSLLDITSQAPDYIPAWLSLMRLYFDTHKYDECKATAEKILSRDNRPPNTEAMFQLGTLALAQHDGAKAVSAFQNLDNVYKAYKLKTTPKVKYYLALAYLENHDKQTAIGKLNEALALDREYSPAVRMMADLDYRGGNLTEAITLLSQLIEKHPEDDQAQFALAEIYQAQQRPDRALDVYQQMLRIFSKNPEIPRKVGLILAQAKNADKAREAFEKSLELAPDYMPTLENITILDINQKRFAEAHSRLAAFIETNPKAGRAYLLQGAVYLEEGQTNQAEAAYSKAVEINPELTEAYLELARLSLSSHKEKEALDRLVALVARTNNLSAMQEIGELHESTGQYEQARDAFEKVLAVDPNFVPALNDLAYLDSEFLGNPEKALELAEKARNLRPTDPNTADTLGWILFKKRQYAHALSLLQESVEKQPNNPEVQMHLGLAYYMMGEEKPARTYLQRALASQAEFTGRELARRRLEVLDLDPATATPEAIQKLQEFSREDPQDPVPWSRLASIQEQRGEFQKAAESLQTLISINPDDWPAMMKLSRLNADHLNDLRKALDLAKSAHSLAPDDGPASALLGGLVYRSGDFAWASSLLEQAASQSSNQPSVFYQLALAYYAVGRVSDADTAMQKAVQAGDALPNLGQARQFLALRAAAKDPAQAQASSALVQQLLAKDPNYVPALMVSALLAERSGAADEAEQICQKVLSIYPLFAPAMRELAIIYSHSQHAGDQDKAYQMAEKARASLPDDLELAKTLGLLAYRRAEYSRSMPLLRECAEESGKDGEVLYYLGMDYYKLKQRDQSKQTLQHALDLGVPDSLAGEARTVIKELQ